MQGREPGPQDTAAARIPSQQADQEDRRLIDRVKAGDHEALDVLFQCYFAIVSRQAIRLTGNREEAEEVVQEAFLTDPTSARPGHTSSTTAPGYRFATPRSLPPFFP
jgi:hypothetical protein